MRIDLRQKEPSRLDLSLAPFATVYLNDEKVNNCVMADEKAGTVVLHVIDSKGLVQLEDDGQSIKEAQYFGKVKIEFSDDAPAHLIEKFRVRA